MGKLFESLFTLGKIALDAGIEKGNKELDTYNKVSESNRTRSMSNQQLFNSYESASSSGEKAAYRTEAQKRVDARKK